MWTTRFVQFTAERTFAAIGTRALGRLVANTRLGQHVAKTIINGIEMVLSSHCPPLFGARRPTWALRESTGGTKETNAPRWNVGATRTSLCFANDRLCQEKEREAQKKQTALR